MDINLIVATGKNGEIGKNGDLPWHIPEDLRHFKRLTTGHPVIMGRKTWESLPKKPLPGRKNIIITSNSDFQAEGAVTVSSPKAALEATKYDSPFIIGGGEIYKAMLPYVNKVFLTLIEEGDKDADTFLNLETSEWELLEESELKLTEDNIRFKFLIYGKPSLPLN